MREILFRGKRVDNGEFIYGCYLKYDETVYIVPMKYSSKATDEFKVIPETVGQKHNELSRKAKKNIFVGDKIQFDLMAGLGEPYRRGLTSIVSDIEQNYFFHVNVRLKGNIHDKN